MIVHGFCVTSTTQHALIARMMDRPFTAADIETEAALNGVPAENYTAHRLADRLIQRERKAGHIVRDGRGWRWVG